MTLLFVALATLLSFAAAAPDPSDKIATARWLANNLVWGVLSTTSTRSNGTAIGAPFGNPYSFADANNGVPYFFATGLDASALDIFNATDVAPMASLALSEAQFSGDAAMAACTIGTGLGDPENPPCARLILTGNVVKLAADDPEEQLAHDALFAKHPSFSMYPVDHGFFIAKMEITDIWLIDAYGGASYPAPKDYLAYKPEGTVFMDDPVTTYGTAAAPDPSDKIATARWLANSLVWGVLSTTSTRTEGTAIGAPFGNPYSFADVNGVPYFFVTGFDASALDIFNATATDVASLALSEAQFWGDAAMAACTIGTGLGDPENPPCARLVLSGNVVKLDADDPEEQLAHDALFAKHPSFSMYPVDHGFFIAKMEITAIWLIDAYGGASYPTPKDYLAYKPM